MREALTFSVKENRIRFHLEWAILNARLCEREKKQKGKEHVLVAVIDYYKSG